MRQPVSERRLIFIVGAVQFFNILDFMMVMPLGPDFTKGLGVAASKVGFVGGAYTLAASCAGLIGSLFLDRFERRRALVVSLLGLVLGTLLGGFAQGLTSLMLARLFAGTFGGPATSLALAIIADAVPVERRGRAFGSVMGAFSIASVIGVPLSLELSRRGGFRLPFFAVAALGLLITLAAAWLLPPIRPAHRRTDLSTFRGLLRPTVLLSYLMTATVMSAGFVVIPNISPYLLGNLHYPRERLGLLYMVGGAVSFFAMRLAGRLVDRFGSFVTGTLGALLAVTITYAGFVNYDPRLPVMGIFVGFMLSMALRNVAYNTLTSKVPRADERAGFMSIQSAVQHAASALAAFLSASLLVEGPEHVLWGIDTVALISIALTLILPFLLRAVERRVRLGQVAQKA